MVVGGGTGTSTVLMGLKQKPVRLTAIVSVADHGGSTGRLRDEFGFQPVGDLRQSLAALAIEPTQEWIRKLLLYRFDKGDGLAGHNLGNLILTALQDMAGSTATALELAEQIFRLNGKILPATSSTVDLVIELANGKVLIGEDHLNHTEQKQIIKRIKLSPNAVLYQKAADAIKQAQMVVIGPGDVYGSVLPAMVVRGFKRAAQISKAQFVTVINLMNRANQTDGWPASKHVETIEKYLGKKLDKIVINTNRYDKELLKRYADEGEHPVLDDLKDDPRVLRASFARISERSSSAGDLLKRSLLRHDAEQLATTLITLL